MTDEVKFKLQHSEKNFVDIDLSNSDMDVASPLIGRNDEEFDSFS